MWWSAAKFLPTSPVSPSANIRNLEPISNAEMTMDSPGEGTCMSAHFWVIDWTTKHTSHQGSEEQFNSRHFQQSGPLHSILRDIAVLCSNRTREPAMLRQLRKAPHLAPWHNRSARTPPRICAGGSQLCTSWWNWTRSGPRHQKGRISSLPISRLYVDHRVDLAIEPLPRVEGHDLQWIRNRMDPAGSNSLTTQTSNTIRNYPSLPPNILPNVWPAEKLRPNVGITKLTWKSGTFEVLALTSCLNI